VAAATATAVVFLLHLSSLLFLLLLLLHHHHHMKLIDFRNEKKIISDTLCSHQLGSEQQSTAYSRAHITFHSDAVTKKFQIYYFPVMRKEKKEKL